MAGPANIRQWSLVRVPCSTSNLGAGFDCVGLALDRYLEASYEPAAGGLDVIRDGTVADLAVPAAEDVLVQALVERLGGHGVSASGTVRVRSGIPVGRGLGSSAAARVAGWVLGGAALGLRFSREDAFAHATAAEGHPDNAGPCALGGLIAVAPPARRNATSMSAIRLPLSPAIGWAFAAPAARVSTEEARGSLPASVERAQAVDAIRRMAALLRGLETADPALLAIGFADRFHVPYRLPLIPGADAAMHAGEEAGAWAVTISGSGSGLIAACARGAEPAVAEAMAEAFRRHGTDDPDGVLGFALSPDTGGAQILSS